MPMRRLTCSVLFSALLVPGIALAQTEMSDANYIKAAEAGGPADVASAATIAKIDPKSGEMTTVRAGTNAFTCVVGLPGDPETPICGDKNAMAWLLAAVTSQPKPPNTEPGIAYMAKGGLHFETASGDIVMMPEEGTTTAKEPPHWMLLWPFDPAASGLPTKPNDGGVYIMFAGTPYAHLMIYQDPNKMMH